MASTLGSFLQTVQVIRDIPGNDFNSVNLKVVMELRVGYKPRGIGNESGDLVLNDFTTFPEEKGVLYPVLW